MVRAGVVELMQNGNVMCSDKRRLTILISIDHWQSKTEGMSSGLYVHHVYVYDVPSCTCHARQSVCTCTRDTFNTYAAHGSINIPVKPNNSLHPKNPFQVEHVGNYAHLHHVPIESPKQC